MRTPENLHLYQHRAIKSMITLPSTMLWLDMGLGKTISTLTAINVLMAIDGLKKTLVVAPLRVCQTVWAQEARQWSHTKHLRFNSITGSAKTRMNALVNPFADIYLINYENLEWLVNQLDHFYIKKKLPLPFQCIVWDEISKMKNSTTNRGKAARKIIGLIPRKIGLTGTPCSNGLIDLHGQFLVLDEGERLGTHKTHFKDRFGYDDMYSFKWTPFPDAQNQIEALITDITLQMKASDYLDVPKFILNDIYIPFPPSLREKYNELEKDLITQLDAEQGGGELMAFSASELTNKMLQFANGAVYLEPGRPEYKEVHKLKLDALQEIVEESGDTPLLLAYTYRSDKDRILKKFKHALCLSDVPASDISATIDRWNQGEIKLMIGHPASLAHGLNLQQGGHTLVWYGLNWSLDLYEQFNARILRQGQKYPVICHRIMIDGTIEGTVKDALDSKASTQEQLRAAISAYADTKRG